MTCDFAEEIEEIKMKWQFVRVGRREQATARAGWGRIFLPTHRKMRDGWGTRAFVAVEEMVRGPSGDIPQG